MKGYLYQLAILKPQSKFVFPAVEIVSYASLFKETWITFRHLGIRQYVSLSSLKGNPYAGFTP